MAREGLFFRSLGTLSPRTRVPVRAVLAQACWASVLTLSGTYDQLTDSVVFASCGFYALAASAVIVLRKREPDLHRPFRTWGYPWLPGVFIVVSAALLVNALYATPRQALTGMAIILAGLPFYWYWSRQLPAESK